MAYSPIRLAFSGASGTGKSTLAEHFASELGLPFNPVGSRSVSKAMGFETPYHVDQAGKRAEFQRRLLLEKTLWENEHEAFITDRSTMDNLAYTILHDCKSIDRELLDQAIKGVRRYTHIVFCPVSVFCNTGGDNNRLQSLVYHELCDVLIRALHVRYDMKRTPIHIVYAKVKQERVDCVRDWLQITAV